MKQFDYNNYLKNNPLLKEDLQSDIRQDLEKVSGLKISKDDKKIKELKDELEELDMAIYRVEEMIDALEDEGENPRDLIHVLNRLLAHRGKLMAKLEKLK